MVSLIANKRSPILEKSKLEIHFDSEQYWLGEKVTGKIFLTIPKDIQIRGLVIALEGTTCVKLNGKYKSRRFLEHMEKIFGDFSFLNAYDVELLKKFPQDLVGFVKPIKKGLNKFPFELPIPREDRYPGAFDSPWGSILYEFALYIVCFNVTFRKKICKPLHVNVITDKLINDPTLNTPLEVWIGQRSGQRILFNLEKKLVLPGMDFAYTLTVPDCPSASASLTFIQKLYYKITTSENKTVKNILFTVKNPDFDTIWRDTLSLPPYISATHFGSNVTHCLRGLIDVNYFIMLQVENKVSKRSVCEVFPVKVGAGPKCELVQDVTADQTPSPSGEIPMLIPETDKDYLKLKDSKMTLSKSIPTYSMLSLYSKPETLPPSYEEALENMEKLSF